VDAKERARISIRAQGFAKRQLCREKNKQYRRIYLDLLSQGYKQNNFPGGPKAQGRARTVVTHLYPDRYRALYRRYKAELFADHLA
jgi:hypothetical protein